MANQTNTITQYSINSDVQVFFEKLFGFGSRPLTSAQTIFLLDVLILAIL
jgi:hypothetical protein